jgi:phosphoribosylanthranilate isomerase
MIVKICGITNREDAEAAIAAGAAALGFNFWPGSPRYVTLDAAAELMEIVPKTVWKVGVFVDETALRVHEIAHRLELDVVQLHGSSAAPAGFRVWRARGVDDRFDVAQLGGGVEAFLLDAPAGGRHGGTGRTFDWSKIRNPIYKIILAGGLDASNVGGAISMVKPWGVDACSRLESAPGKKDHAKMAAFCRAALRAAS